MPNLHPHHKKPASTEPGFEVKPGFSFRAPDRTFRHLVDGEGNEYLDVKGNRPYGSLTESAFGVSPEQRHLLRAVKRGKDSITFKVPEDTLGMKAASLGTGRRNLALLLPVYVKIGEAITDIAPQARIESLSIEDLAFNRSDGGVLFVPPLKFHEGESNPARLIEDVAVSMQAGLSSVFKEDQIAEMQDALRA